MAVKTELKKVHDKLTFNPVHKKEPTINQQEDGLRSLLSIQHDLSIKLGKPHMMGVGKELSC